jgi:uncharacterized protein with PQ loop repeat
MVNVVMGVALGIVLMLGCQWFFIRRMKCKDRESISLIRLMVFDIAIWFSIATAKIAFDIYSSHGRVDIETTLRNYLAFGLLAVFFGFLVLSLVVAGPGGQLTRIARRILMTSCMHSISDKK